MKRTIGELSASLCNRAEEVAMMLLPGGKRVNGSWVAGDIFGSPGKSLQVHVEGGYVGKWKDWGDSSEYRGDLIDLWRLSRNLSPKETLSQVKSFLGIVDALPIERKTYSKPKEHRTVTQEGGIFSYLMSRKLEPEVIRAFDVRGHKQGEDIYIVFPCFSPTGEWVNNSYRGLKLDSDGKKRVFQDKGCAPCLFGWKTLTAADYASRKVLLCEGQIDAMTWRQWGIPALSIPNGSGTTWIEYEWENLEVFDTIYLSFDMDGKTKDALEKVISRLGKHRCMIVELPEKDANDCLKAGRTAAEAKQWIAQAKAPAVAHFLCGTQLYDRVYKEFYPDEEASTSFVPHLLKGTTEEKSFRVRLGEVSVWTGIAGQGKSKFLMNLLMELMGFGQKSMIISPEMLPEKIVREMIRCASGRNMISPQEIRDLIDGLGPMVFFCDKLGYVGADALMEMMEFAYCRYGVTQFLIDSLMRIDGLEEDYPAQGKFLNSLTAFAKTYKTHIHLVSHPRKTAGDERPTANDLKGSSLIRNNADNIFVVTRNLAKERQLAENKISQEEADKEWDAQVMVEKDREAGHVKHFKYRYEWKISRFTQMR